AAAVFTGLPQGEAPAAAVVEANLMRSYKAGETQAYTTEVKVTLPGMDDKLVMSGGITWKVTELTEKGAKIEATYKDVKMLFGGEEAPMEGPAKTQTFEWNAFGIPVAYGSEAVSDNDNPISGLEVFGFLPNLKATAGKDFTFTWQGEETKIEGKGKLIATGRLYEEHVAKVEIELTESPKSDPAGKYEYTAYFNTESGKLVKAEGTYETESEEMGGKMTAEFVMQKVRG
ncbi:MAG: hypothetical protein ABIV13_07290, partial [Fimbriimonadales bacterium]